MEIIYSYFCIASLVLRIRCDAKASQCPLGDKYGCDPVLEAPELIQLAKSLDLNVSLHKLNPPDVHKIVEIMRKTVLMYFQDDWH